MTRIKRKLSCFLFRTIRIFRGCFSRPADVDELDKAVCGVVPNAPICFEQWNDAVVVGPEGLVLAGVEAMVVRGKSLNCWPKRRTDSLRTGPQVFNRPSSQLLVLRTIAYTTYSAVRRRTGSAEMLRGGEKGEQSNGALVVITP